MARIAKPLYGLTPERVRIRVIGVVPYELQARIASNNIGKRLLPLNTEDHDCIKPSSPELFTETSDLSQDFWAGVQYLRSPVLLHPEVTAR